MGHRFAFGYASHVIYIFKVDAGDIMQGKKNKGWVKWRRLTRIALKLEIEKLKLPFSRCINRDVTLFLSLIGRKPQGHPTDCFGGISVRKTCNRLKFSVREMLSRAFLIKIN